MTFITRILAIIVLSVSLAGTAQAQNFFGAIAYSPQTGAMGWAYDHPNRGSAEGIALRGCYNHASDCRIAIWFQNACGALAVGRNGGWGSGWGTNRSIAESYALNTCSTQTGGCSIRRWVCTRR